MSLAEMSMGNLNHLELYNSDTTLKKIMDKIRSIFTKEQKNSKQQQIIIPEGKMAAPGDHETIKQNLSINGEMILVPLIRQTYAGIDNEQKNLEGNCAEYAMLNTAILMIIAGFKVNRDLENFLPKIIKENSRLAVNEVEIDLIIPLIRQAQQQLKNINVAQDDLTNIIEKVDKPYTALTTLNTVFLFRYALSHHPENFQSEDLISIENIDQSFSGINSGVYMVGSPGHATSLLKINNNFYVIDTYTEFVSKQLNTEEARSYLLQKLGGGAFIIFNPIES